jgi:TusA-related sulfurtransferase
VSWCTSVAKENPMIAPESQRRLIDLRGLRSPQPVLVLADEAERVGPGETIGILSDDRYSQADFLTWCVSAQMDVIEMKYLAGGVERFVFRRPQVTTDPGMPLHPQWGHAA